MTVTDWPAYVLRRIPPHTRDALSARALADDISLADVVRQALCAHYNTECDPASFGYQPERDGSNDVLLIRIQPAIWKKMRRETRGKYGATKVLVLDALTTYLGET